MVRTKASSGAGRVTVEKAPRKNFGGTSSRIDLGSPSSKKDKYAGGNPVCPRPTPNWQKPIDTFFTNTKTNSDSEKSPDKTKSNTEKSLDKTNLNIEKENVNPGSSNENISPKKRKLQTDNDNTAGPCGSNIAANGAVVTMDDEISED